MQRKRILDVDSNDKETMYLLSTKNNREVLEESNKQIDKGETKKFNSINEMFGV